MIDVHVLPEGDIREHVEERLCPCLPRVRDGVVIHNSYDGREVGEVLRKALDWLGWLTLENAEEWPPHVREAYEHATHLLNMHWPKAASAEGGDA